MESIRVVMPKQYDLVVGDTFQLFYRGIIEAPNPFCYDILSVCEKGRNYPRYFEYLPQEVGQHKLTVSVYDAGKNLLGKGETILNVVEPKKSNKDINILCVGDSGTAGGVWPTELYRRLNETGGEPEGLGFGNVRLIGTCTKGNVGFEGYGGWKWNDYLATCDKDSLPVWMVCDHNKDASDQHSLWKDDEGNIWQIETLDIRRLKFNRFKGHNAEAPQSGTLTHYKNAVNTNPIVIKRSYNEAMSPFYSEETKRISFAEYCRRNNFDAPDLVYIKLGYNGLLFNDKPWPEYCQKVVAEAKQLIDVLHSDFPDAKVRIMGSHIPSVHGGTGASYGAELPYCDDYGLTRFMMEMNIAYQSWANEPKYCGFVEYINISGQFDTDYNMPKVEKCVNTRSNLTESIDTNGLHPTTGGYMQVADAVYRNAVKSIAEID